MKNYQHYLEYLTQTEGFVLGKHQMNVLNENYTQSSYGVEFILYTTYCFSITKTQRKCKGLAVLSLQFTSK